MLKIRKSLIGFFSIALVCSQLAGGAAHAFEMRRFPLVDWHRGHWVHNWHGGRVGWWWVTGPGSWYWYPRPVVIRTPPPVPGTVVVQAAAPASVLYYCRTTGTYLADPATCPGG